MPTKYPQSFKDRATRMVFDRLENDDAPSRYVVIRETAPKLSIATETLRRWVEQAEVDTGKKPGVPTSKSASSSGRTLQLRRANEILKTASAFFAAELDRPTTRRSATLTCSGIVSQDDVHLSGFGCDRPWVYYLSRVPGS